MEKFEAYGPIESIASGIYCVTGDWQDSPLKRRMTLIRMSDAKLIVHSPIRMVEKDMKRLEELGKVVGVAVPNLFHGSEAPFYAARYPGAKVLVPDQNRKQFLRKMRVDGGIHADWPGSWKQEIEVIPLEGCRVGEVALYHSISRTVIFADAVFNMESRQFSAPLSWFMKWNRVGDRLGPSRLFRLAFTRDRQALRRSWESLLMRPIERVIMSHGAIYQGSANELLRRGFDEIFGVI